MFSPSAAPRWKIATSTFLRAPCWSAAKAARSSQSGAEPTPAIAMAELRRKILRESAILPSLKIRGTERQPGGQRAQVLLLCETRLNRVARGGRCLGHKDAAFDLRRVHHDRKLRRIDLNAADFALRQRHRE